VVLAQFFVYLLSFIFKTHISFPLFFNMHNPYKTGNLCFVCSGFPPFVHILCLINFSLSFRFQVQLLCQFSFKSLPSLRIGQIFLCVYIIFWACFLVNFSFLYVIIWLISFSHCRQYTMGLWMRCYFRYSRYIP
jgi:hypothetical protein